MSVSNYLYLTHVVSTFMVVVAEGQHSPYVLETKVRIQNKRNSMARNNRCSRSVSQNSLSGQRLVNASTCGCLLLLSDYFLWINRQMYGRVHNK